MNFEAARLVIEALALIGAFAAWFYAWQAQKSKASHEEVAKLRESHGAMLARQGEQIARVEVRLDAMPDHGADIQRLHDRISGVKADVGKVSEAVSEIHGEMRGVRSALDRLSTNSIRGES